LLGKPERKRLLGRSRRRWDDNIKMDLRETYLKGIWIHLAQDRDRFLIIANKVMNPMVP
jgi:hypothetical protein